MTQFHTVNHPIWFRTGHNKQPNVGVEWVSPDSSKLSNPKKQGIGSFEALAPIGNWTLRIVSRKLARGFLLIAERHRIPRNKVLVRFGLRSDCVALNQIIRQASVHWKGDATGSTRTVNTESGVLHHAGVSLGVPLKSTMEADPPELIAAAHASSFSLALSEELAAIGFTEGEIVTTAMLTLEQTAVGWTIVKVNLNVAAKLPQVTQAEFIDATLRAKTTCMVSRSLRANISMNAKLEKIGV